MRGAGKRIPVPEQQADATLNQANPVSGTKYVVLDTTEHARIIGISVVVTWTVQPTPLEIHMTIDGQSLVFTKTDPVSATQYAAQLQETQAVTAQSLTNATRCDHRAFLIEGRSIKIEAETTGGTVSNLSARVKYAKW